MKHNCEGQAAVVAKVPFSQVESSKDEEEGKGQKTMIQKYSVLWAKPFPCN